MAIASFTLLLMQLASNALAQSLSRAYCKPWNAYMSSHEQLHKVHSPPAKEVTIPARPSQPANPRPAKTSRAPSSRRSTPNASFSLSSRAKTTSNAKPTTAAKSTANRTPAAPSSRIASLPSSEALSTAKRTAAIPPAAEIPVANIHPPHWAKKAISRPRRCSAGKKIGQPTLSLDKIKEGDEGDEPEGVLVYTKKDPKAPNLTAHLTQCNPYIRPSKQRPSTIHRCARCAGFYFRRM